MKKYTQSFSVEEVQEILNEHIDENDRLSYKTDELYNADPECDHHIVSAPGGGVKCNKCAGWFCY